MPLETHVEGEFYLSARGAVTARLLRSRLARIWPDCAGQSVLGIGYALPYLRLWWEGSARCIALTPPQVEAANWPADGPNASFIGLDDALPLPDLSFDRVLLVHSLELAESGRALLREVWRVLKDDGRLVIVAANRRGMWAHLESTPFGQGRPVLGRPTRSAAGRDSVLRRAPGHRALRPPGAVAGDAPQRAGLGSDRA